MAAQATKLVSQVTELAAKGSKVLTDGFAVVARNSAPAGNTGCACADAKRHMLRDAATAADKGLTGIWEARSTLSTHAQDWFAVRRSCVPGRVQGTLRTEIKALEKEVTSPELRLRDVGRGALRAAEIYGFFAVGIIIGRGSIVGYQVKPYQE